ncbi:hypothetical protein AYI69_g6219 [Smittium culicis]|uniref:Uncharacterized protein n=1 Tax=Smittium culicis TaxID=133412 RepID=A0A1R1Y0R5_9FUNG|nr:hypothetical protein AYI69_g6219 [Smittium culicis]
MEQASYAQVQSGQDQLKLLIDVVHQLLKERECHSEPEDPYVTTRFDELQPTAPKRYHFDCGEEGRYRPLRN